MINQSQAAKVHSKTGRWTCEVTKTLFENEVQIAPSSLVITDPWGDEDHNLYRHHLQQKFLKTSPTEPAGVTFPSQFTGLKFDAYVKELSQQLELPEELCGYARVDFFINGLQNDDNALRSIHSLRWELLGQVSHSDNQTKVTRRLSRNESWTPRSMSFIPLMKRVSSIGLNVLLVAARADEMALTSSVYWSMRKVQSILERRPSQTYHLNIYILRPASVSALRHLLEYRGYGFFDIVHIDAHGEIKERCVHYPLQAESRY